MNRIPTGLTLWRPGALPWPFGPGAAEGVGSHPAAGVAIDAGLVHVEVALLTQGTQGTQATSWDVPQVI